MFILAILILFGICIGRCYANIFANVCLNYYYYIMPLCYVSGTRHMNIEADVIAFDCIADVIAMQL